MLKLLMPILAILMFPLSLHAFELLLDPGHSPKKGGAMSCTGESEYKYNDALVAHIVKYLKSQGIKAAITRKPNQEMSLSARGAASQGKDLLVSIHHDSVQPQFMQMIDGKPQSTKGTGYSIFVSRKNPHFKESLAYARKLGEYLASCQLRPSTHHGEKIKGENRELLDARLGIYAFDDLVVLKTAKSPALLFEAGVLVHPHDEEIVRGDKFRDIVARAVESAISEPVK